MKWISEYDSYFKSGDMIFYGSKNNALDDRNFIIKGDFLGNIIIVREDGVEFQMDGDRVIALMASGEWVNISKINRERITIWQGMKHE